MKTMIKKFDETGFEVSFDDFPVATVNNVLPDGERQLSLMRMLKNSYCLCRFLKDNFGKIDAEKYERYAGRGNYKIREELKKYENDFENLLKQMKYPTSPKKHLTIYNF